MSRQLIGRTCIQIEVHSTAVLGVKDQPRELFHLVETVQLDNLIHDYVCDRPDWVKWNFSIRIEVTFFCGAWLNVVLLQNLAVNHSSSEVLTFDQFKECLGTKRCDHLQSTKCNIHCLQQT